MTSLLPNPLFLRRPFRKVRRGLLRRLRGSQKSLQTLFDEHDGRQVTKWANYIEVYARHLRPFRGKRVTVVEFGVKFGGSLQLWRKYFGSRAMIYGVDIDERCVRSNDETVRVLIGDQADRNFLASVAKEIGPIDVLIDDGGHYPEQQIATFEVLYPNIKSNGIALIEDLHTNYWGSYGGGLGKQHTFVEYAKRLVDQLTAWHSAEPGFAVDDFTRSTKAVHFYNSVIVFEKAQMQPPRVESRGTAGF